jgi:hypothetical protein
MQANSKESQYFLSGSWCPCVLLSQYVVRVNYHFIEYLFREKTQEYVKGVLMSVFLVVIGQFIKGFSPKTELYGRSKLGHHLTIPSPIHRSCA